MTRHSVSRSFRCPVSLICVFIIFNLYMSAYEAIPAYSEGYMNDWNTNWAMLSGRINQQKCVNIPDNLSLCNDIGYKSMRLPNLLEHDSLAEVTQQAASWTPLLGIQCHPDTKLFLCSLFSPVCLERRIWPCRSLCEAVKSKCESSMNRWGFPWPEMVRCDKFPVDNDLCISPQMSADDNVCEACKQPNTFESLIDNFCRAEFVLKMKIRKAKPTKGYKKLYFKKKKKFYKKGGLKKRDVKKMVAYIKNGDKCECSQAKKAKEYYIIMAVRSGDAYIITYVNPWLKKDREFKRALRAMRKSNVCNGGVEALEARSLTTHYAAGTRKRRKNKKTNLRTSLNLP